MGEIEYINMPKTSSGDSKGYCFIQYKSSHDAKSALDRMNGYELGARCLKVELVKDDAGHIYKQDTRQSTRTPSNLLATTYLIMRNVFDAAEYVFT